MSSHLGYFVRQVRWSPNGLRLLTRSKTHIMIWSSKGDRTITFENRIELRKNLVDLEWLDDDSEH